MSPKVSKLAVVDRRAEIADDVEIGHFCVVGPKAKIGRGTKLMNNVTIDGAVEIGEDNVISPNAVIGGAPQDTTHDCVVGDTVIIGHGTMLGGHVHVDHHATLSGNVAVTHYGAVGSYTFVGGASRVLQDIAPYMLADGNPARPRCINVVALRRNDFDQQVIDALDEAYRLLYRARVGLDNAREILQSRGDLLPDIEHLLDKIAHSQTGRHGRGREQRRKAA